MMRTSNWLHNNDRFKVIGNFHPNTDCRCIDAILKYACTMAWAESAGVLLLNRIHDDQPTLPFREYSTSKLDSILRRQILDGVAQSVRDQSGESGGPYSLAHIATENTGSEEPTGVVYFQVWAGEIPGHSNCEMYAYIIDPRRWHSLTGANKLTFSIAASVRSWFGWWREKRDRLRSALQFTLGDNLINIGGDLSSPEARRLVSRIEDADVLPLELSDIIDVIRRVELQDCKFPEVELGNLAIAIEQTVNLLDRCPCALGAKPCRITASDGDTKLFRALPELVRVLARDHARRRQGPDACHHGTPFYCTDSLVGSLVAVANMIRESCGLAVPKAGENGRQPDLTRILLAETLSKILEHPSSAGSEVLAATVRLSVMILCELDWTRAGIDAWVQVLSFYAEDVVGVPARLDLRAHLRQGMRGEPALHTLKEFYRDHFFHAVEVCLLGHVLLSTQLTGGTTLSSELGGMLSPFNHDRIHSQGSVSMLSGWLLQQWWIAALLHDVGYSIELVANSAKLLKFFSNHSGIRHFGTDIKDAYARLAQSLDYPTEIAADPKRGRDHGVIAAAHLGETARIISRDGSSEHDPAIRAIAFHNSRVPWIDGAKDPIAALLVICDSLQEWSRINLGFEHAPQTMLSQLYEGGERRKEAVGNVEAYHINIHMLSGSRFLLYDSDPRTLRFKIIYQEAILQTDGDVFSMWMDMLYNLQRVDIASWPINIIIELQTPIAVTGGSEWDRLIQCIRDVRMPFLSRFIKHVEKDDGSVRISKRKESDLLTIDLVGLGAASRSERLLGGSIANFYKKLQGWPKFRSPTSNEGDASPPV